MKEKLIEVLGLKPAQGETEVSDQAVIDTVIELQREASAETDAKKEEAKITALVKDSGFSLSRTAAKQVLADRAIQDKKNKEKDKSKK